MGRPYGKNGKWKIADTHTRIHASYIKADNQTTRHPDSQTARQPYRQTYRQTDRQTDRQTHTHTHTHTHNIY